MPTIDASTGKLISGIAEAFQSLATALSTQKNTRIMRRNYGVERTTFVDRGVNKDNLIDFYAEIAEAIAFEPRFRLVNVKLSPDSIIEQGQTIFDLELVFYRRGHLGDFSEAETVKGSVLWNSAEGMSSAA